nr:MAG TPA: hypothetical protein [Caudoviricetes sp.]
MLCFKYSKPPTDCQHFFMTFLEIFWGVWKS